MATGGALSNPMRNEKAEERPPVKTRAAGVGKAEKSGSASPSCKGLRT